MVNLKHILSKTVLVFLFMFYCMNTDAQKVNLQSTNLPLFIIDTKGQSILNDPKIVATLKIVDNGTDKLNKPTDIPNGYNGNIGIEMRGSFSQSLPQKPYGFETLDDQEEEKDIQILGFPKDNDWILLANYNDKSFVRNSMIFEIWRQMGYWAPHTKHCEVLINNEYQGIYVFTEKIKRDNDRVDISKLDNDDNAGDSLTGGYIFKVDYSSGNDSWESNYTPERFHRGSVNFIYTYPKPDEITTQQRNYLKNYVDDFEDALFSNNYKNETTGYPKFIDVNSFVDYFIIGEITRNVDAYKKSCFYSKQSINKGGLIAAGPVWDFDWAMKNFNECIYRNTDGSGWAYEIHDCTDPKPSPVPPAWMNQLVSDPYFANKVYARYFDLRKSILSEEYINNYIDSVETLVWDAQGRHYQVWKILGQNVGTPEVDKIPDTFMGENQKLKDWFSIRLAWLDENMIGEPTLGLPDKFQRKVDQLAIFPNPATDYVNVESDFLIKEIKIVALDGKVIQRICFPKTQQTTINVDDLVPGFYLLIARGTNSEENIIKFIKK
jgi:hypothetical protein